jgi:Zn-dependent protease
VVSNDSWPAPGPDWRASESWQAPAPPLPLVPQPPAQQWPPPSPPAPPAAIPSASPPADPNSWQARLKRFFAPLAGVAAFLAKFGLILLKLKSVVLIGSAAVSVLAYAQIFGWKFAVGFVLLIFVHEMGHVIVLRARGIKAGWPVFLPFLGAFVSMKSTPRSVYDEAESALAGPVAGTIGALAVGYVGHVRGSDLLLGLAFTGLLINLFNLLPALPLDGGRVAGALHPVIWLGGLVALLGFEIYRPSPVIPILLILGGYELYRRWRGRDSEASKVYFALRPGQRARIGTAYLVLLAVILIGMHVTYAQRHFT